MPGEIVSTELLSCSYREGRVLEDISFGVQRGDYVGIVGPNGSGKSTLIKAILGLVTIGTGSAALFGTPCRISVTGTRSAICRKASIWSTRYFRQRCMKLLASACCRSNGFQNV